MSLTERCEGGVIIARRARKPHRCDTYPSCAGDRTIKPGETYLIHRAFPHTDHNSSDRIWTLLECAVCARPHRARLLGLLPTALMEQQMPPCAVAFCRKGRDHGDLHDIAPCLRTCGPLRYVNKQCVGRLHDPACRNARDVPRG